MTISLKFLGATRNVTGSCYLLETATARVIVDCGLYQEREFAPRNWAPSPARPSALDAIILTHAHLDHCGLLPKIVREGFAGPVICTEATAEIARIVILDSAKLQEEDAAFKRKRHEREGRKDKEPAEPLYTVKEAETALTHLKPVKYGKPVTVARGVVADFVDAGHILGSAMVRFTVTDGGTVRKVLFSGDVGRWDAPILQNPTLVAEADFVLVESTYGDRVHDDESAIEAKLARIVNATCKAGGNVVIPAFAIERAQEVIYRLNNLRRAGKLPHVPVFLDSPMAVKVTEIFNRHPELFDDEARDLLRRGEHPCDFADLHLVRSTEESKALNVRKGASIILAGSGMCTGGRIKHHLVNNITRPESTILFVGFQASGTLGRILLEGAADVRLFGQIFPVRAKVAKINGFSGHADREELDRWLSGIKQAPRRVFVIHGEPNAAEAFAAQIRARHNWTVTVPSYGEQVELE
ncbi:MAG: MBL fold metallo-hydrolase [Planctomycetota bacterium]